MKNDQKMATMNDPIDQYDLQIILYLDHLKSSCQKRQWPADKGTIVVITKVIGSVSCFIALGRQEVISQESELIAGVCEIPIFIPRFSDGMHVMQGAPRPKSSNLPRFIPVEWDTISAQYELNAH